MDQHQLDDLFDRQAATYDDRWVALEAIRAASYQVLDAAIGDLPEGARVLAVGPGTGVELAHLAARTSSARFTVVEPAPAMLDACRRRAAAERFADRCDFHLGTLDTLPAGEPHDLATAFLVSQFVTDRSARVGFFAEIADRLVPGAPLVSADLTADPASPSFEVHVRLWLHLTLADAPTADAVAAACAAYTTDVAVRPRPEVEAILAEAGFGDAVAVFQAALYTAWVAHRTS